MDARQQSTGQAGFKLTAERLIADSWPLKISPHCFRALDFSGQAAPLRITI